MPVGLARVVIASKVAGFVGAYAFEATMAKLLIKDKNKRLHFYSKNVGKWSKRILKALNIDVQVVGRSEKLMRSKNFLIVSNHMSYLDILLTASVQPSVFVTSVDLGEDALLGTMAEMGGSIFVERRKRSLIERDVKNIVEVLRGGHNVILYPEGTSTDGCEVRPFKKSLLKAGIDSARDILPMCLKYTEIDGETFARVNADKVCWYGDMPFAKHLIGLLNVQNIKAEVHFLEPILVTPDSSRHELAELSHRSINEVYGRVRN
jgi:1-acyl-sn-glycerol-3-phosphate acyltransferase